MDPWSIDHGTDSPACAAMILRYARTAIWRLVALSVAFLAAGCASTPLLTPVATLEVPPGPEDMVLDMSSGSPRIIAACGNLAMEEEPGQTESKFIAIDVEKCISDGNGYEPTLLRTLNAAGAPAATCTNCHGISITTNAVGETFLYVASHVDKKQTSMCDRILAYEVDGMDLLHRPDLGIPQKDLKCGRLNDLCALPSGEIFVTVPNYGPNVCLYTLQTLCGRNCSSVWHYARKPGTGDWQATLLSERGMAFANGIHVTSDHVYVACLADKRLVALDHSEDGNQKPDRLKRRGGRLHCPDNLSPDKSDSGNCDLWVASHRCKTLLGLHFKNPRRRSPTVACRIRLNDDGYSCQTFRLEGVRAGATAVAYRPATDARARAGREWLFVSEAAGNRIYLFELP
jgi:hypothetical protein